jgi:RsiW-degrading membrane proteinase PrsW (M82 family)
MQAVIALVVFGYIWLGDYRSSLSIGNESAAKKQTQGLFTSFGIIVVSLILVNYVLPEKLSFPDEGSRKIALVIGSILISGLISLTWYIFISWLDIYEQEKFRYMFLTFIMACGSTFLVFTISPFWDMVGLHLNGEFWNDFAYSSLRVGLTEELVKFLPFLIMLLFSKQIDEPFDYILFGATSALGFAFIENIQYLFQSDLVYANGRAFYASVGHIFDTGIICYCIAIAKHKGKNLLLAALLGFILASLAHGFYDFWLISDYYKSFWPTFIFFLFSLHLFAIMKNNLINISPFYEPDKRLDVVRNKNRLFNLLLLILFVDYISFALLNGVTEANGFLQHSVSRYTFIMIYLVLSFNSTNIIHGYIAPIGLPRVFFKSLFNRYPNYLGARVKLADPLAGNRSFHKVLPMQGRLMKRVVIDDNFNWYHFEEDVPSLSAEKTGILIVKPARTEFHLFNKKYQTFRIALVSKELFEEKVSFNKDEIRFLGNVKVRALIEPKS